MKRKSTLWFALLGLLAWLGVLVACDGGGGGGGEGTATPATYDGNTEQAVINANNAVVIVSHAWELLIAGRDIGEGINDVNEPTAASVPMALAREKVPQVTASKGQVATQATVTESGTLPGDCGGNAFYNISVDDMTGEFTGQISFVSYCSEGVTMTGITGFSGRIDPNTLVMTRFRLTFDDLDVTDGSEWYTFTEGSVTYVIPLDLSSETDTLNFVVRDNNLHKSYWLNNCVVKITFLSELADEATISGRFYDHDYGYVDISTLTPLLVPDTVFPTAGVLVFTGKGSKARLTFNADESTLLEVDADNDGAFDDASFVNPL